MRDTTSMLTDSFSVAGIDFGSTSVRARLVSSLHGCFLTSCFSVYEYEFYTKFILYLLLCSMLDLLGIPLAVERLI